MKSTAKETALTDQPGTRLEGSNVSETELTLQAGARIGSFKINEFLGKGSQADVYRASQGSLGRDVALKILHPQWAANPNFLERFQQEALRMAQLEHEHMVPIYDSGQEGPHTYLAMKFIPGGALDDYLEDVDYMELDAALDMTSQVAKALDFAHDNGIIHRDVKPGNVLIDEDGKCYLTDFGIAKAMEDDLDLTTAGAVFGTANYMSPEQCQAQPLDGRTDLYALATMLFEMITGALPFTGKNVQAIALRKLSDPPAWPEGSRERLGAKVVEVLERSLAVDPDDRPTSCAEMIGQLDAVLREEEPEPWKPAKIKSESRRPAAFFGSAVACGVLVGSGAFFASGGSPAQAALPIDQPDVAERPDDVPPEEKDPDGAVIPPVAPEKSLPLVPPPVWPEPDATAPTWEGPSRIAVRLDGSSETWAALGAPAALQDRILSPLRKILNEDGWDVVVSVVHPLPEGPFEPIPEWIRACADQGADLTLLVGMTEPDVTANPGTNFSRATFEAEVPVHAHMVGSAELGEVADPLHWGLACDGDHPDADDALRAAIVDRGPGVVAELAKRATAWRNARSEEGLIFEVAVATEGLPEGSEGWIQAMLKGAPGGRPEEFQSVGSLTWSEDESIDAIPLPAPGPKDPKAQDEQPESDPDRTYTIAPDLEYELEDGQQLHHYRLRYRGSADDLLAYVREGLERYTTWALPKGSPAVRVVQKGGALLFVLP